MSLFVVIEGIDGTGKSTVTQAVSEKLGWNHLKALPDCFRPIVTEAGNLNDHNSYHLTVLGALKYVSTQVESHLEAGENVISDRYVLTPYFYHRAVGKSWGVKNLMLVELEPFGFVKPDLTIHLTVSEEARQKRLSSRGKLSDSDKDMQNRNIREEVLRGYTENADVVIDTTNLTIDEVVKLVEKAIERIEGS